MSDYLTPTQVAQELDLCETTVYRGLRSGQIPGEKVMGSWRTLREQLEERIRDNRIPTPRSKPEDPMPRPHVSGGSFREHAMANLRRVK